MKNSILVPGSTYQVEKWHFQKNFTTWTMVQLKNLYFYLKIKKIRTRQKFFLGGTAPELFGSCIGDRTQNITVVCIFLFFPNNPVRKKSTSSTIVLSFLPIPSVSALLKLLKSRLRLKSLHQNDNQSRSRIFFQYRLTPFNVTPFFLQILV